MTIDPRLQSVELLMLAAFRLRARRQHQAPDWRSTVGMSALLEAARAVPKRDPWDMPPVAEHDGLAGLLAEARQWKKDHADGN